MSTESQTEGYLAAIREQGKETRAKCSECGGVNGHANPFCSKLNLKAALAEEIVVNQHQHTKRYRIEWRPDAVGRRTMYWNRDHGWLALPGSATIYNEAQRTEDPSLPDNGIWIVLNEEYSPAGALNVHQLTAIGVAIRETIEAGADWKGVDGLRRPWVFYAMERNWQSADVDRIIDRENFIAEVQRRLTEKAK